MKKKTFIPVTLSVIQVGADVISTSGGQTDGYFIFDSGIQESDWQ